MYINRGPLLNILLIFKKLFIFLNKHFYIILIISTITKYTNNKIYKYFIWVVKLFVLANLIISVAYIIYFTISFHSLNYALSAYSDLITLYLTKFINLWNDFFNLEVEDNLSNFINKINDISNKYKIMGEIHEDLGVQIKQDLGVQIKDGVKEALN